MFKRLQKLHLCASHQTTLNTLDYLGKDFDASVMKWKSDMMEKTTISSHIQVCDNGTLANRQVHVTMQFYLTAVE